MSIATYSLCKLWNLRRPLIPPRSRLYHLEPEGIGTPYVESLIGYIARLAETHCVPSGVLMERELAPLVSKTYGGANLHRIYAFTGALNGTGVMAMNLIQALQSLTLRSDLSCLTMLTWSELIPSRNLLCSVRAWCPACYEEWLTTGQVVYEPLLWSLRVVKVCPYHEQHLSQKCPYCNQQNNPLAWRSRPGYCSKCFKWLGLPPETPISDRKTETEDRQNYEIWSAKAIGELVAKAPDLELPPTKDCIAKALSVYVEQLTEGNIATFARQLGIPRNTLWLWCKGKNLPSIDALVKICYCLRVSVLNFLTQGVDSVNDFQTATLIPTQLQSKPRASSKAFDSNLVQQHLKAVLVRNDYPPPSMEEVARSLKCPRRTIYKYFPDLCRAISANYRSYRKAKLAKNIEQSGKEARQIALHLHKKGVYPSESRVSELMSMPGHLRYKKVRAVLQEVQRELGKLS